MHNVTERDSDTSFLLDYLLVGLITNYKMMIDEIADMIRCILCSTIPYKETLKNVKNNYHHIDLEELWGRKTE